MIRHLTAELLDDIGAVLGEGPNWDARSNELVSVDILAGKVHLHDAHGTPKATYDVGGHVGSALPAEAGGWLLARTDGFDLLQRDGAVEPLLAVEADRPELRFNDAKCDPWGQALAGTMRYDEAAGSATLYRLEAAGGGEGSNAPAALKARALLERVGLANGLGWNADGDTLYFIDSLRGTVARYPYEPDDQALGPGQDVVTLERGQGLPDGMCVDEAGMLWVALHGGSAVHRFRPDGALDTIVDLPVPLSTSVAFGGAHGDRLFITTASGDGPRATGAGGLWAVDPGIAGAPATPWRRP